MSQGPDSELGWLLDRFVDRTPGAAHAVVVSTDGLQLAATRGLPRERGEQLSAVVSGLASLTAGAATLMGAGDVRQTLIEMRDGFLLVMTAGDGAHLAVLASADADLGQVGYETAVLVERVGVAVSPRSRTS